VYFHRFSSVFVGFLGKIAEFFRFLPEDAPETRLNASFPRTW
jgi:hypothetical protein